MIVGKGSTRLHKLVLLVLTLFLVACNLSTISLDETPSPFIDDLSPAADGWSSIAPGIDYREVTVNPSNAVDFTMSIVRINPAHVEFRVHYDPQDPLTASGWAQRLSSATAFINGNFFVDGYTATGLVVSDGVPHGISYAGYGGMFQVGTDGSVRVRSLVEGGAYGEPLFQAVQAFPLLIDYGGRPASTGPGFDDPSRRSIIAQDFSGNILLISTGLLGEISFRDAQTWLVDSGLGINIAFALDGGKSSTLLLRPQEGQERLIPSFTPLPVILAVYPR